MSNLGEHICLPQPVSLVNASDIVESVVHSPGKYDRRAKMPKPGPSVDYDELLGDPGEYLSPSEDEIKPSRAHGGRRKSGTTTRNARDMLRKSNHSRIEKRRREKINEALASLRDLVPHSAEEEEGSKTKEGSVGRKKEDKEFKLEVLERTVIYVRKLKDMVRQLEESLTPERLECGTCGERKRRKLVIKIEEDEEMENASATLPTPSSEMMSGIRSAFSGPDFASRLPPISSLISCVDTQSQSQSQLPSPPSSVHSTNSTPFPLLPPPALSLPSPHPHLTSPQPSLPRPSSTHRRSPTGAPWTRDDDVASLLLQFSSEKERKQEGFVGRSGGVHITPASLLGLDRPVVRGTKRMF
jgi:hypothetical protein